MRRAGLAMLGALLLVGGCNDSFKKTGDGGAECSEGQGKCEGEQAYRCVGGMAWELVQTCVWPMSCYAGECTDPCSTAKAERSYVGCEYFAVDLDNAPAEQGYSPREAQFAIVVSYAGQTEHAVHVKVFTLVAGKETVVAEGDVFPGGVRVFNVGPQTDTSGSAPVGIRRHAPRSTAMDQRPDKRPRRHPETTARRDVAQGGRHPVTLPRLNDSMVVAGPLLDGCCRRWKSGFLSSGHPTDSRPASALVEQLRSMQKGVDDRQPVHLLAVLQILAEHDAAARDLGRRQDQTVPVREAVAVLQRERPLHDIH